MARKVPESLQQLIEQQLERLSPEEQRMSEAASVAGAEFSAAAVAAGLEAEVVAVEERCEGLVRRDQWLQVRGIEEWPDGTVAARYGFLHSLYQEVTYQRVTAGRRVRLHKQIGEREEVAYGERAGEIAAELAVHFEQGLEYGRAVQYLGQAGERALRRSAYQEASSYLTKGLELLQTLPDTSERAHQELRLQIALGVSLMATQGWAAPAVGASYARAQTLCEQVGESSQLFRVLHGLWVFHYTRAELPTAQELAEQLLTLAERSHDVALRMEAHHVLGNTLHRLGELTAARAHLEQGLALYDPQQHCGHAALYGLDDGVTGLGYMALVLWALGYPDQARQRTQQMLTLAREVAHPASCAWAYNTAAWHHHCRREEHLAQAQAAAGLALCTAHGFAQLLAVGTILRGWALAAQGNGNEGIAQMQQGLAACQGTGAEIARPRYLAMLAQAYGHMDQPAEGLALLAEAVAVAQHTEERFAEAEFHRLKGELTLQSRGQGPKSKGQKGRGARVQRLEAEAEECFHTAIESARRQSAKSFELRAALSLSRLWQRQGRKEEAWRMLAEIYGWFTEGFDTKDLQEAKVLLAALT